MQWHYAKLRYYYLVLYNIRGLRARARAAELGGLPGIAPLYKHVAPPNKHFLPFLKAHVRSTGANVNTSATYLCGEE